nr:MAG TPA: hypothetical protein [Caudoviricetes sp.]
MNTSGYPDGEKSGSLTACRLFQNKAITKGGNYGAV